VRLPCCDGGGDTTVAAHYRSLRLGAGARLKPHDLFAAWACAPCHDVVDARVFRHGHSRDMVRLAHAEAVLETIYVLLQDGRIVFK
jgi:hypothetical protein